MLIASVACNNGLHLGDLERYSRNVGNEAENKAVRSLDLLIRNCELAAGLSPPQTFLQIVRSHRHYYNDKQHKQEGHPLNIFLSNADPVKLKTGCLVVPVANQKKLTGCVAELDAAASGAIREILKQGDLENKPGASVLLQQLPGVAAKRVLLLSCGDSKVDAQGFGKLSSAAAKALANPAIKDATTCMTEVDGTAC